MVITEDIYGKVMGYSNKIARRRWGPLGAEDLAQDVILKLLAYNDVVEHLPSFIFTVVKHTYITKGKSHAAHKELHTEYYDRMPQQYLTDTSRLVKQDFEKLLDYFPTRPACKQILKILLEAPDESHADLAKANGIAYDTFKANIRHIREVLNSVSTNY